MLFLQKPRYYDAPDGEAPIEKIVAVSKKGFVAALVTGIADCIWITDTRNALDTANCMAYWIVPFVGMSATWASVTYMSTKLRGKDDWVNYVNGALACSPILHAWRKRTEFTIWTTGLLIIIAAVAKHSRVHEYELMPVPKRSYGYYEFDFTVTKDVDKDFRSPYPLLP